MDKAKKKRIKKVITWVSMALVVALLTAMPLLARQEAEADGPVASILSAEVKRGSVSRVLRGGGTISSETVKEVKLPDGVKITEFLVKNGQFVTEGTPIATVDKVSVMTAITEVNETMKYLREELEAARDEKVSSTIKATAGGRVKKLFAQKGEEVRDVMLRDGALAILSLDGLMAVKLEEDLALTTGENVVVLLGDEQLTGRVESNLDGVAVITVEDEGYEIGAEVTVMKSGVVLGEGELYIHNAWKASAYTGTIENVKVKEEKTLSSGATLFTLKNRDYEGELRHRSSQHREYEQLLQKLFQMYESGVLTAPCDGEVEGVEEDSAYLLAAVPDGWRLAPLTNTVKNGEEKAYKVQLLGAVTKNCTQEPDCQLTWQEHLDNSYNTADCKALCQECHENAALAGHAVGCITFCSKASETGKCPNSAFGNHYTECIESCTPGTTGTKCAGTKHHKLNCIESCKEADGLTKVCDATGDHKTTCIKACDKAQTESGCDADPNHDVNCIKKCNEKQDCPGNVHKANCPHKDLTYTARVGIVVRVVSGQILYTYETSQSYPATKSGSGYLVNIQPNPKTMIYGPDAVPANGVSCSPGDIILVVTGRKGENVVVSNMVYVCGNASSGTGGLDKNALSGLLGGRLGGFDLSRMIGGFAGYGNYGAAAPEEEPLFDLEGNTLLTVTPHDKAKLYIAIDERDISKVTLGMEATVKVEALKGEEFPAEVTKISQSGTNNGGSSKFSVELTLPMSQEMLPGMSASAVLPMEEKTDVLLIPAAALTQQGAKTVVFTALDEKTGEPSNPVEVTTGFTDGENVEVISGLSEGQKIYYSYYDTVELDTSAQADKYTLR